MTAERKEQVPTEEEIGRAITTGCRSCTEDFDTVCNKKMCRCRKAARAVLALLAAAPKPQAVQDGAEDAGAKIAAGLEEAIRFARGEDTGAIVHHRPAAEDARACTCHPDDSPPKPCPQKFALTECRAAAVAEDAVVTDDQCRAAIAAMKADRIQGFSYGMGFTAPHVVRDVHLPREKQELWRGYNHKEMLERCEIEKIRIGIRAAIEAASMESAQ